MRKIKRFIIKIKLILGFNALIWIERRHQALGWSRDKRKTFWHGFVNWENTRKATIKFFIHELSKGRKI
jgi:hypothetical protein